MFGVMFMVAGIALLVWGRRKGNALHKYEFENRSTGGVVGFKTYEDSESHERTKKLALAAVLFGAVCFVGGCTALFGPIHP